MRWYIDRRAGLTYVPWRMLPAIPLFVVTAILFAVVFAPFLALILLARWGCSWFMRG
jgi:hypothetical protein